ncbi:MAG: hypothetical protein J6X71_04585 [Bacteroidales bacterium]|nr:hypothetical protein [Bacteroidales bacterium]
MRNFSKTVLAGAIALAGVVACTPKEDFNPNYNKETGEVLTSFVFNVSATNSPTTKQTAENTQAVPGTSGFLGITDASLLSFMKDAPAADGKWIPSAVTANKQYSLGAIMSTSDATTNGDKSHRVIELSLPTETNTLMFYGRAPLASSTDGNPQGLITYNIDGKDLSAYQFSLTRRVATANEPDFRQYGDLIRSALDYICAGELDNADVVYNATHNNVSVKWTHYVTISSAGVITPATKDPLDGSDMCSQGEILADALATLATVYGGEVRAGSGTAVARTIGDLKFILNKIHDNTPSSLHDAVAKALAENIIARIENCFTGTAPTLEWKTADQVKSSTGYTGATDKITRIGSTGSALSEWPDVSFGVPKGCAQLKVQTTASTDTDGRVTTPGTISWLYSPTTPLLSTSSTSIYNVYYPAELCYFGNSPIRVTDDAHVEADYPQGVTNWDADAQWAAGVNNNTVAWSKNSHVISTTRSVAMQYNINYGTALLKTTVSYQSGITQLQDNNHNIQLIKNPSLPASEEPNAKIDITDTAFKLNGVLVGGQPTTVGWDFVPVAGETFDHNIYDKALPSGGDAILASGGTTATPNYTMVWDNWNAANVGSKQNDVYVALEFINNSGKDFWGNKNIIRNGGTFYIIGKLNPDAGLSTSDRSEGITWPDATLQALPPFDASGNTIKERRVFIQDFMTTANFIIGKNSLQSAYATVPDLRSTQISLGLSVDLHWQTGLVFNDIVLGQ